MGMSPERTEIQHVSRTQKLVLHVCAFLFRMLLHPVARLEIPDARIPPTPGIGLIIVANHRSMLDMFVGIIAFRKWGLYPVMLVRGDFCELPVAGRLLRALGGIPAGRGYSAFGSAKSALNRGRVLVITPEGRVVPPADRSTGLGKFRPGVGHLAAASGAPIMLVAIVNTDACWPLGAHFPRLKLSSRERPVIRFSVELVHGTSGASSRQIVSQVRDGLIQLLRDSDL